jgi:hypothetical protein
MLVCTMYVPDWNKMCVDINGVRRRIHACMYDVCT